ncbi:Transport and Golgi organization protein 2 [Coemansia sp. BCRC 34301]|nr:Transport and Golgi organization protein 2 [Coemansia sp. BCRC 34301]
MCIVFWKQLDDTSQESYSLVLAFNRDEFFDRPTRGFHRWPEHPAAFAPQDLKPTDASQRGAWLGVNLHGHLALLTNFREPVPHHDGMTSRGALVRDFLLQDERLDVWDYAQSVYGERHHYDGFNLVLFDLLGSSRDVVYVTNRGYGGEGTIRRLESSGAVAGLSNSTVDDCSWPKVREGREAFARALDAVDEGDDEQSLVERLMQVMSDTGPFCGGTLPQCLDDLKRCIFVPEVPGIPGYQCMTGQYGTRTTDVVLLRGHSLTVAEREHSADEILVSHLELFK